MIELIKSQGAWWHHLDSTWLVKTNKSATGLRDELVNSGLIDSNDELLVIDVTGDAAAWFGFTDRGGKWLKDNL
ncbi:hypothetical protein K8Z61_11620 [Nocardioides sp. TRM66260-LWL]|uniref:hypothetical protein n=1 Tax=Nocardioides sp. TRM66260-LWL TaxID=2874478 RepID=UPI001CC36376|nr:hypothetical protein [Nocardioides sp. TRM66260-LWL]MBZ5735143.1 hypothetical protein [Nocardioides sp. TRM66260-LWL]